MKKLLNVLVLTLALNFIGISGGVIYLFKSGKLDKEKVHTIKELLFAPPAGDVPTTQPSAVADPTTQPTHRLDQLLAKASGRNASEQVEFIQQSFDAQMAQLDRRQRELADLQRQVDVAKAQMSRDRTALDEDKKALEARQQLATRLANDKGFQDSLVLYTGMPGKKVKEIFMTLTDDTVMNYLQAMPPRSATKIIKEFKSPEEVARIQIVMEKMRQARVQVSVKE